MKNRIEVLGRLDIAGIDQIKRVYSTMGIAPTVSTMQGGAKTTQNSRCRVYFK